MRHAASAGRCSCAAIASSMAVRSEAITSPVGSMGSMSRSRRSASALAEAVVCFCSLLGADGGGPPVRTIARAARLAAVASAAATTGRTIDGAEWASARRVEFGSGALGAGRRAAGGRGACRRGAGAAAARTRAWGEAFARGASAAIRWAERRFHPPSRASAARAAITALGADAAGAVGSPSRRPSASSSASWTSESLSSASAAATASWAAITSCGLRPGAASRLKRRLAASRTAPGVAGARSRPSTSKGLSPAERPRARWTGERAVTGRPPLPARPHPGTRRARAAAGPTGPARSRGRAHGAGGGARGGPGPGRGARGGGAGGSGR